MNITFAKRALPTTGALSVFVGEGTKLSDAAREIDEATEGQLTRAIKASRFEGKIGQLVEVLAPVGVKLSRVIALGVGDPSKIDARVAERIGAALFKKLGHSGESTVSVLLDPPAKKGLSEAELAAYIGSGALLTSYSFDKYFTKKKPADKPSLKKISILTGTSAAAKKKFAELSAGAEGVMLARDLMSEPPNVLTPAEFAKRCKELSKLGCQVSVLTEAQMKKLGMDALLGVGQGSENKSHIAIMHWKGGTKTQKPLALVGKGVCFDTGGISLKPGAGMGDMKGDMGGAAAVTGAMHAIVKRKAKANVIGLVGLVENMPDGKAQRPGDIVTSMSGQTIEILNTDAEGRLVLADVLHYANTEYKPAAIVDLATLTGAILVSLGNEYAGLFSNNDKLADQLTAAGKASGDELWRLPLSPAYDKMINSKFADMQNIGGRNAGSITAAQFLKRFVGDTPWAHLDIAGTAWDRKTPVDPAWATGFGVRLLDQLVKDSFEK